MASPGTEIRPSINPNDHGPRVTIVGAIMLAATLLMIVIAFYNRYNAGTMHHPDSILILIGAALDVTCLAVFAVAVSKGFGQHTPKFSTDQLLGIERLFLVAVLLFFLSHGVIKISYNILARKTSRSDRLKKVIDGFSTVIGLWTLSNIIVIAIALAQSRSPARPFFWVSGVVSMLIVVGQLVTFLWIIWRTKANLKVKVQWSISMGAFVPLCIAAISVRLAYTPSNYFAGDWTFNDVLQAMIFLIELNLVTITILAPNLPVFFKKTSTGGVYFLPGEAVGGSKNDTQISGKVSKNDYALSDAPWSGRGDKGLYAPEGDRHITTTTSQRTDGLRKKRSFDSDVILMSRSIEVERGESESHISGDA